MKYQKHIKRYVAPIMAALILCSSIGVSSYARFCNCSGQEYHSLFIQNQGDCCKKEHQPKAKQTQSCCSKEKTSCEKSEEETPEQKKNCCDTEIELLALDLDATLDLNQDTEPTLTKVFLAFNNPSIHIAPKAVIDFEYEEENRKSFQAQAPPPLRTNQRLQALQTMRC